MKKYCILLLIMMPIFTACNDWLEESDYTYAIATSTFYNTVAESDAAVMAPLNQMRSAYNANYFTTLESNTEYVLTKGSAMSTYGVDYNGILTVIHLSRIDSNWELIYIAIKQCNIAIQRIPDANAMSDNEKAAFIGELRFLRAFNYFQLVRRWGSVPLRTDKNMDEWDLAKSSVNDIYNFIIEDLKYAVDNCPNVSRWIGTPCVNAAKALLADVYMFTKDYASAKTLSEDVIKSGAYSLVRVSKTRDFDKLFGYDLTTSTEEVFFIKTSRTDSKTWEYPGFTSHPLFEMEPGVLMLNGNGYWTHYSELKFKVVEDWDTKDLRFDFNLRNFIFGTGYDEYTCLLTKFWDPYASGYSGNVNIPFIRYADVLITYAEATARVAGSPTAESIEMLNQLRRRGYGFDPDAANPALDYKLSDYNSMDQFIDLLINEERYERMNEGKHWDFILRLGKAQDLIGNFNYHREQYTTIKERHYLWRIPDSEFNYNKALDPKVDQNPGYNE